MTKRPSTYDSMSDDEITAILTKARSVPRHGTWVDVRYRMAKAVWLELREQEGRHRKPFAFPPIMDFLKEVDSRGLCVAPTDKAENG